MDSGAGDGGDEAETDDLLLGSRTSRGSGFSDVPLSSLVRAPAGAEASWDKDDDEAVAAGGVVSQRPMLTRSRSLGTAAVGVVSLVEDSFEKRRTPAPRPAAPAEPDEAARQREGLAFVRLKVGPLPSSAPRSSTAASTSAAHCPVCRVCS